MKQRTPMAELLARIGWRRDASWRVLCRDQDGRRVHVRVELHNDGVVLHPSRPGPLTFRPLEVGRLRNALREAVFVYSDLRSHGIEEADHDHGHFAA